VKRFLATHYDCTGYTVPSTFIAANTIETTYGIASRLIRTHYEDDLSESPSIYYTTPVSSLILLTGDLLLPSYGLYTFKITATNTVLEIIINGTLVAATYIDLGLGVGIGTITLPNGLCSIKVRFIGATAGNYSVTWKAPGQGSYSTVPTSSKPMYGNTLFPFDVYDNVNETINAYYTVNGQIYQKQQIVTNAEPSKAFEIILKQDTVKDRVLVRNWFTSMQGKYHTFLFNARNNAFTLDATPTIGTSYISIKKSYATIVYSYVNKILYFPEINFISKIVSVEEYVNSNNESCEKLNLMDTIPTKFNSSCPEINFLYYCRLNTDTLTFELEDINFSSVKLSLMELYNDNSTLYST
jgi:hypothetical protein